MPSRAERKETSRLARRSNDRAAARGVAVDQLDQTPRRRRGGKTHASHRYGLEIRIQPGKGVSPACGFAGWQRYWKWYATAAERDTALAALNRKDQLFEYRAVER